MTEPVIRTQRLDLYRPQTGDLDGLFRLTANPDTRRHLGPTEPSKEDSFSRLLRNAGSWSLYGYGVFVIRLTGQQEILGTCGIFRSFRGFGKGMDDVPEGGWIIDAAHCGCGYAREAMEAALAWFDTEHGSQRIACMIEENNAPSNKLAVNLGFVPYDRHEPEDGAAVLVLYQRIVNNP
ncbi:MAG: GNAT family N-acetyltransferase [Allopontixanthobacter sediminis]